MTTKKVLAAGLLAMATAAHGGALQVGTHVDRFSLADQFDRTHTVDGQTRLLLFSRDKDMAKMAFELLDRRAASYLADRGAHFILDISAMPAIVTNAIGKPRMRRHSFPLLLDTGPGPTRALPAAEKKLTLVYLRDLAVERISYVSDAAALEQALEAIAQRPAGAAR